MISQTYRLIQKGEEILGKVFGIITAGIFIGTAVVEISGYLSRKKEDRKSIPAPEALDAEIIEKHDETTQPAES